MPKRKFTVETPHGVFTRTTGNQYACISVWQFRDGRTFDVWHFSEDNAKNTNYKTATRLGIYEVAQLPPEAWESKRKKVGSS
jgi:hypothetical protein